VLLYVPPHPPLGLRDGHGHGYEVHLVSQLLVDAIQLGLECLAVLAPGRPELDEGELPTLDVVQKLDRISLQVFQGCLRCLGAYGEGDPLTG
jgi:hypothetical protein